MLFLKAGAPRTRHIYSQSLVAAYIYGVSAGHQLLEIDYLGFGHKKCLKFNFLKLLESEQMHTMYPCRPKLCLVCSKTAAEAEMQL